jgi:serine/threonine-protein phosphatase CPPED1
MTRWLGAILVLGLLTPADELRRAAKDRAFPDLTRETQGTWTGPFFFIQLADPQFGFMDAASEAKNAELAVEHVNRLKPRFVVVCGDLVHPFPGGAGYDAKVAEFKRIFSRIDPAIPLVCVAGNHDVGNRPTPASLASYRKNIGEDWFGFWAGGTRALALNSTLIHDPAGAPDDLQAQDAWFRAELEAAAKEKPRHLFVFQHHAWFLKTPDEPDGYFAIPRERRTPALAAMKAADVRAVFAGHYHGNARGRDGSLEMITTGPVGKPLRDDPSGLRIVEVFEDRIRHAYYALDDVPAAVPLK